MWDAGMKELLVSSTSYLSIKRLFEKLAFYPPVDDDRHDFTSSTPSASDLDVDEESLSVPEDLEAITKIQAKWKLDYCRRVNKQSSKDLENL
jgi:hypothetical protein